MSLLSTTLRRGLGAGLTSLPPANSVSSRSFFLLFLWAVVPLFRYGIPVVLRWLRDAIVMLVFILFVSFFASRVFLCQTTHFNGSQGVRDVVGVLDRSRDVYLGIFGLRLRRISFEGRLLVNLMFVVRFNVGERCVILRLDQDSVLRLRKLGHVDGRAADELGCDVQVARRVGGFHVKRRFRRFLRTSHIEKVLTGGLDALHVPRESLGRFNGDLLGGLRFHFASDVRGRMFVYVFLLVS